MTRAPGGEHRESGIKDPATTIRGSLLDLFRTVDSVSVRQAVEALRQFNAQQIRASLCGMAKDGILDGSGNAWDGTKRYRLTAKGLELARRGRAPKFTTERFEELSKAFGFADYLPKLAL